MGAFYPLDGLGLVCFKVIMKKLFLTLLLITGFFSSQTWGFVVPVKQVEYEGLVLRNDGLYYKEFTPPTYFVPSAHV